MMKPRTHLLFLAAFTLACWPLSAGQKKPPGPTPTPLSGTADGWKLIADGRYAEAEKMARELLVRTEARSGPKSVETAEVLDVLCDALWRSGKTKDPEALDLIKRAVAIKESALGPDHPKVANSLMAMGSILQRRGQYTEARPVLERVLSIRQKAFGEVDVRVGDAEHNLGAFFHRIDQLEMSESHYRKALSVFEKTEGPESEKAASSLEGIASVLADRGRFAEAEGYYERSLGVREKLLGPKHPNVGISYNNIGYLHQEMGEYEKSLAELERALEIRQEALGEKHPQTIMSLGNLAITQGFLGLDANATWERAVMLADQSVGPRHHLAAELRLNNATSIEGSDLIKARQLREQALAVLLETFGPENPRVLWNLTGLGNDALKLGDLDAASRSLEQAVTAFMKHPDEYVDLSSGALMSLGECRLAQNRGRDARTLYDQALAMREKVYGPDHDHVAEVLELTGDLLQKSGDFGGARLAYSRALSIREKAFGEVHQRTAESLLSLADLEAQAGDLQKAKKLFERAVATFEKTRGPEHPRTAEAHQKYATCLLKAGETRQALQEAVRAEAVMRPYLRLTISGLPERQALSFVKKTGSGLNVAISAALLERDQRSATPVLDALIRSRALVLDEMARRHQTAWAEHDASVKQLLETYAVARQRLANLTVRGEDEKYPEKSRARLEKANADKEAAERTLAERSLDFRRSEQRAGAGLSEVAAALPHGSVLVAFVRFARQDAGTATAQKAREPVDSYAAFVLRQGFTTPVLIPLGPAGEIDREVAAVRRVLSEGAVALASVPRSAEAAFQRTGSALRRRVWDPLQPHLAGAKSVFLVPDGSLQLVNFAALPESATAFVIEKGPKLHYLSAERDLLATDPPTGVGLLAAGGPDYDASSILTVMRASAPSRPVPLVASHTVYRGERPRCSGFESLRFRLLPAARLEIEDVAAAWREGTNPALPGPRPAGHEGNPLVLPGASANELAIKTNAPGKNVLHLATHGYFLGECSGREAPMAKALSENPLLLSGLALAGANHRAECLPDAEDGILTAEEIAALDLSGVEWAVLSACETGIGEIRSGESLFGLRRAFRVAGARTLILSLWPVEDESSREWMRRLYRNRLVKQMTTVDAVYETSLQQLRQRRVSGKSTHPIYWAGFVAAGDWR